MISTLTTKVDGHVSTITSNPFNLLIRGNKQVGGTQYFDDVIGNAKKAKAQLNHAKAVSYYTHVNPNLMNQEDLEKKKKKGGYYNRNKTFRVTGGKKKKGGGYPQGQRRRFHSDP